MKKPRLATIGWLVCIAAVILGVRVWIEVRWDSTCPSGPPRIRTAQLDGEAVRAAAESYNLDHALAPCPTTDTLVEAGELRRGSRTTDPWSTPYRIECREADIVVRSAGPDRRFGTEDDTE